MSRYANWRARRPPKAGTKRARHWRTLHFGDRIVNKHGRLTDWEVCSPPYKKEPFDVLVCVDVCCLACGEVYVRHLNNIIQGGSYRCRQCWCAGRKAPRTG